MCYAGGPYCYDKKLSPSRKIAAGEKRAAKARRRLSEATSINDADRARTNLAYANLYMKGGGTLSETDTDHVLNDIGRPDGGATFSPTRHTAPTVGFCYSVRPERGMVVDAESISCKPDDPPEKKERAYRTLQGFMDRNKDLLENENNFVGLWNDPQTGKVYVDVSTHTMRAERARKECAAHEQLAFFDLQTFESVDVLRG